MNKRWRRHEPVDFDDITKYARHRIDSLYEKIDKQPITEKRIYRKDLLCELYYEFGKIKSYSDAYNMMYKKRGEEIKNMSCFFAPKGDSDMGRMYRRSRERYLLMLELGL